MADRPSVITGSGILGGGLALALLAMPVIALWTNEPFYITLATRIAILALAGVGLNLALGLGGLVSFGHAAFFGAGGYVTAILASHAFNGEPLMTFPFLIEGSRIMPVLWLAAMVVSALLALVIGAFSLRTSGVYFIMITLAFAQMVYYLAISWPAYGGEDGLSFYVRNQFPGIDTLQPFSFFMLAYGLLMGTIALTGLIANSRFGTALQAARQNEERTAAAGISTYSIKLCAFVLSAAITGLAGALFADLNRFVSPSMLSWHTSGQLIVFIILGGVGRLFGPIAGAGIFIGMEFILGGLTEHWQFFLGFIILGTVLFARGGLIGLVTGNARHG